MSYHEKENQNNNRMNTNLINDEMASIIDSIIEDDTYQEGKNRLIELFKLYISNDKLINLCLTIINNIIILKGNSKHKILSTIPEISQINPKSFYSHVDIILSIFQSCLTDDNSPFYTQISQYFGDTVKVLLVDLNSENYNTYFINENQQNIKNSQKVLLLVYTKFKLFCLSNIKSNNAGCQICGTLCLTSFIENCSFNYINNENLKCILDNLCMEINNPNFPGKLEILNCFISLVFSSEEKYVPYSIMTLNVIIKFIQDPEWLIRKFALNIIYTMLYYCKKEISEKREFIIDNLKLLKNDENLEVKEIAEQIFKMLNEEESTNMSYNNKINFLSDSLLESNHSKLSSSEQSKNYYINNSSNNKEFKVCEEEKNSGEMAKPLNAATNSTGLSKKKFKNSLMKNYKSNNEKNKIKAKSDKKRKTVNKYNDVIIDNFMNNNNSSSKKMFSKLPNNTNNTNPNTNAINESINNNKKRKVFSDNLSNKTRNKKVPPSRNSVERLYGGQKKNPISMILKKRNILPNIDNNNSNNYNNNYASENKNNKTKTQEKESLLGMHHSEKSKKIISLNKKQNNLKNIINRNNNNNKKINQINDIIKNHKMNNSNFNNPINQPKQIIGRNNANKSNDFIGNTTIMNNINRTVNNRDILTLNKIPSFGKESEEGKEILNNRLYSGDNSDYIDELKAKVKYYKINKIKNKENLIKLQKKSKQNYSLQNKKIHSKKNILNKSVENNNLNNLSNEFSAKKDNENKNKIQNTVGNYVISHNKYNSKSKFNPSFLKKENSLYNYEKSYPKYRHNNSQKNNKIKRITKIKKSRMTTEMTNNKSHITNLNNNNYDKDSNNYHLDNRYKFSPGSQLHDSLDFHNLLHSFSNKEKESKVNTKENRQKSTNVRNDSKKVTHKANHSFQLNENEKKVKPKLKNAKNKNSTKTMQNKKIQIQRKSNMNKNNKSNIENKNININNVISNNYNMRLIHEDKSLNKKKVNENKLNFEEISKKDKSDEAIEEKFKEYKTETSKIINDLKSQVNILKSTLGNFEETNKKKEKLIQEIKNNNYGKAFEIAVDIGNIQDIYYVIKKYQLSSIEEDIPAIALGGALKILCEDILSCENIRLVTVFIISSICDKNIKFENDLNRKIYNTFVDLYNKRKELCLMKKDISNILKIINYFSIRK